MESITQRRDSAEVFGQAMSPRHNMFWQPQQLTWIKFYDKLKATGLEKAGSTGISKASSSWRRRPSTMPGGWQLKPDLRGQGKF